MENRNEPRTFVLLAECSDNSTMLIGKYKGFNITCQRMHDMLSEFDITDPDRDYIALHVCTNGYTILATNMLGVQN